MDTTPKVVRGTAFSQAEGVEAARGTALKLVNKELQKKEPKLRLVLQL